MVVTLVVSPVVSLAVEAVGLVAPTKTPTPSKFSRNKARGLFLINYIGLAVEAMFTASAVTP